MKPFDLEAAKRGEPIVTRDGRKVTFVGHASQASKAYRLVVLIEGAEYPPNFFEDGVHQCSRQPTDEDLFMAPCKRTVYMNIYTLGRACWHGEEEVARRFAKDALVTAMPIEIEV